MDFSNAEVFKFFMLKYLDEDIDFRNKVNLILKSDRIRKVFLGGTCNESNWRNELIPMLKIDYFNPVVDDWTEECQAEEYRQKALCKYQLYVITPRMSGTFSIAEIIESTHTPNVTTVLYIMNRDESCGEVKEFDKGQLKSLKAVSDLAENNGAIICNSLQDIADFLNN